MLTALRDIGEVVLEKNNQTPLEIILENPEYENTIVLNFNSSYYFQNIDLEKTKLSEYKLYLYRKGPSNGAGYSPTTKLTEFEKSFHGKFLLWFKDKQTKFSNIYNQLNENIKEIEEKIKSIISRGTKKDRYILTLKIDGKYPYKIDMFRKEFENSFWESIKKIKKDNGFCSICGEMKPEIFTTSEIYKFYNLDKKSYVSGGFNPKIAWRNFPICEDCFLKVLAGKKYVEDNLKFKFYTDEYFLIPQTLLNKADLYEILDILSFQEKNQKLTKEHKKILSANEKEIIQLLEDFNDTIAIYLLFLQRKQSAERIILLIEDILPSWISYIFSTKTKIDKKYEIDYTFEYIYLFFPKKDISKDQQKIFIEIINKIFKAQKVNFELLINFFMKKIRQDFIKGNYFKETTKKALINLDFLDNLGIIDKKPEEVFCMDNKFEEIYQKYSVALNSPIKKGVFLLGSLTQMLINVQYAKRGQAPFLKNLKGLKMDINDMKSVFTKAINKFIEYDSFDIGKKEIAQEISKNFLTTPQQEYKISSDELNFYFVSGMTLSEEVANLVYKNKEKEEAYEDGE